MQNDFKTPIPPRSTYWPSFLLQNSDILDIFDAEIPSGLYCSTDKIIYCGHPPVHPILNDYIIKSLKTFQKCS